MHAEWNQFITDHQGSFLQSWEWGQFQEAYGRPVERIQIGETVAQVFVHTLPAGRTYLFSPYGPLGCSPQDALAMLDAIQNLATKYKAIFWRYERCNSIYGGRSTSEIHPEYTALLQLADSDTMLNAMKPKWRYNIRLAERKGVQTRVSIAVQDVDAAFGLLAATAKRQGIQIHAKSYYQLMLEKLGPSGMAKLYLAEYDGKVIAANMMIGFGSTMTYVHGGTDNEYRHLMAPHLLQWQAMLDAYRSGYSTYDFFGIAPPNQPNHPWAGITRFKMGFGATVEQYDGTFEIPLNTIWYNAYTMVKHIRPWI